MLLEKVIECTIDIPNPINFCADRDRHINAELQNKYVGRCFMGSLILKIVSVLASSSCHIVQTNETSNGYVDVKFLAKVIIYSRWDILTGVQIISHQQMVVGSHEGAATQGGVTPKAVVAILNSKSAETLAVGQKVSIRVVGSKMAAMQGHANVVGAILTCDQMAPVVRLRGSLDAVAGAALAPMLAEVDIELAARAKLIKTCKSDLWFFEHLLYSYREFDPTASQVETTGGVDWTGPATTALVGAAKQNILEIIRGAIQGKSVSVNGIWSRPLSLCRSSPLAAMVRSESSLPSGWLPPAEGNITATFAEYLKNILDFLVATRELTDVYNTRELIESHLNIWTLMRSAQVAQPT